MKHKTVEALETDIRRMRLHLDRAKIEATYREMEARRYREKFRELIKEMKALDATPQLVDSIRVLQQFMQDQDALIDEMYVLLDQASRRASKRRKAARRRLEIQAR